MTPDPQYRLTVPVLYYHLITAAPPPSPFRKITVPPGRFARQLRVLRWLGWRSIGLDEFMDHLEAGTHPAGRRVAITFDDGHADNATTALPLLRAAGFGATVFVAAGAIGGRLHLNASPTPEGEPIVTPDQIRQMIREGMDVQSHGMTHRNLADLPPAEAREEIVRSKEILEQITERPVRYFAHPYGSFKPAHLEMLAEAGYRAAFSTVRGKRHSLAERFCLKRIPVHFERSLPGFLQYLYFKSYARAQAQLDRMRSAECATRNAEKEPKGCGE